MTDKFTKGEMHGCIVCGKLYQLYVVRGAGEIYVDAKVMSEGGRLVRHPDRPLVACVNHSDAQVESAVARTYGKLDEDDDKS